MEKAYFGMNTLRVTYGPHGNKSHKNSWAIDLGGADTGIDPFYAPYTGIVRRLRSNSNELWFESSEPVQWADGTQDYVTIMLIHANSVPVASGQTVKQGEHLYNEGTKGNATGNHIHFEVGKGKFVSPYGWYDNGKGDDGSSVWNIYNQVDPTRVFFLKKDTKIMAVGSDNTTGASLNWKVDDGTAPGTLEKNSYFTVGVGNMEYFSTTDVNSNLGYLENGRTYIAYDSYVGSDYTWWRFRHPDGNLYWTAMIWNRCSAYGTIAETKIDGKVAVVSSETALYNSPDPFNVANSVLPSNSRTPIYSQANLTLYDKTWYSVQVGGKIYWVPSDSISIEDTSWEDLLTTLPSGSTLTTIVDGVYYYSEPNPSKAISQLQLGITLTATRQSWTGIMNYNWYEAMLEDGTLVYIVVNDTQVTLTKGGGGTVNPPIDPGDYTTEITGIDVSKYQSDINWDQVRGDPQNIQFAFIRAVSTRDATAPYVDEYLIQNMQGAQAAGIPYGVYIFTYGDNEAEIDAEVDLCINQLSGFNVTYPVAWDFEADNFKDTSKKEYNTDLILYALRRIQKRGYLPILYTYYSMIKNYVNYNRILENGFDIWIADYRGYNGFVNEGGKCTIWQYTSSGSVNGISGRCDMDTSYFDYHRYITDNGWNNGATSQWPSEEFYGYLTINASNAEAFPYPSVNAEGNYFLLNGASYSVIGKCTSEIEGYTWYLIKDNNLIRYVPFLGDRMTLTEGNFITSSYRFYKTTTKTWLSNYETMEYFDEPNVNTQLGYLTRNSPYEVFGILVDVVNDYKFVIIKMDSGYHYCVDFSKDDKCFLYESEDRYPLDAVQSGTKLTTNQEWIGYWEIPSTYDNDPLEFLDPGKYYDVVGKLKYRYDRKTWYAVNIPDVGIYYVMDDGNSTIVQNQYNIPYDYQPVENTNIEICAATNGYTSCDESSTGTPLVIDKVYSVFGKITDSSVSGEWYIIIQNDAAVYVKNTENATLIYTGEAYQRTECTDYFIPNAEATYYDSPSTNPDASTVKGTLEKGTVIKLSAKINRTMVGGVFYAFTMNEQTFYTNPEAVQSFVGTFDLEYEPPEIGFYLQTTVGIDYRSVPHNYAAAMGRVEANVRLHAPLKMKNSADGNTWWAIASSNQQYVFIMHDDTLTSGYQYTIEDMDSNFYCTSETANVVIYSHCATDPDSVKAIVEAPAEVLVYGKVTDFEYPEWYATTLEDGTVGYICANENYKFDYQYNIYQLSDYAHARVSQKVTVYERPSVKSTVVKELDVGEYPVEFMVGGDGTVDGTWLMIDDDQFVQTGSTVTLVYIYPSNVVSKFLVINVTGADGLKAYTYADPAASTTIIPYGIQVKPTSTFEANGHTWYTINYAGSVYYVMSDDPNMTLMNVYDQNPVTEGFCAHVLADGVLIYNDPSTMENSIELDKDQYYQISSSLVDEINSKYWYSLIFMGQAYYMMKDQINVEFLYKYPSTPIDTGIFLQPLIDDYEIVNNPIDKKVVGTIDTSTSIEVLEKLDTQYDGCTWYMVHYNDQYSYVNVNADGTNARIYDAEADSYLRELKKILASLQTQKESITQQQDYIAELSNALDAIEESTNNLATSVSSTIENLQKVITKMEEDASDGNP